MLDAAKMLATKGYNLFATGGTHRFLAENGIPSTKVYWPSEKGEPQALKMLHEKQIDMVVNSLVTFPPASLTTAIRSAVPPST